MVVYLLSCEKFPDGLLMFFFRRIVITVNQTEFPYAELFRSFETSAEIAY